MFLFVLIIINLILNISLLAKYIQVIILMKFTNYLSISVKNNYKMESVLVYF